jgi:hypothetical protein
MIPAVGVYRLNYFYGLVFKKFQGFFFNPSPSAGSDNHNCINNANGEGGMGGPGKSAKMS